VGDKPDVVSSPEPEVVEPSEPEVGEASEPEVVEPSEPEVVEPSRPEVVEPSEPEVVDSSELEVVDSSEPLGRLVAAPSEAVMEGESSGAAAEDTEGTVSQNDRNCWKSGSTVSPNEPI
jgi:hypothetical protein